MNRHWSDLRGCVATAVRDRCSSAAAADLLHPLEGLRFRSLSYAELLTLGLLVQNRDQTLGQIAFALAASVPHDRAPYTAPSRPRSRPGAGRGHDSLDMRQTNVDSNVKGDSRDQLTVRSIFHALIVLFYQPIFMAVLRVEC